MKGALILRGGPRFPNQIKARNLGVTRFYWEAEDPALDKALFTDMRGAGWQVGIMRDPHWHNDSPETLAKKLNDDLVRLGTENLQCSVQADIEYHDNDYVLAFLKAWRAIRPMRATEWTMEPFQGGWFRKDLVAAINADPNLLVIPQGYYGNMTRANIDQIKCDILVRGVNCARVKAYYADLPGNGFWDGVAWDFATVPVI